MTKETMPQHPLEIRTYPGEYAEQVFRAGDPGLNMADFAAMLLEPAAHRGAVYVQALGPPVDGKPTREKYYFDGRAMLDPQKNQMVLLGLGTPPVDLSDPIYGLIPGGTWTSPMGKTGIVEAVVVPWGHAVPDGAVPGQSPPTVVGLKQINAALQAHGYPVPEE